MYQKTSWDTTSDNAAQGKHHEVNKYSDDSLITDETRKLPKKGRKTTIENDSIARLSDVCQGYI